MKTQAVPEYSDGASESGQNKADSSDLENERVAQAPNSHLAPATNHLMKHTVIVGDIHGCLSTNWVRFTNGFTLTNGLIQFDDADAPNHPRRFYRVIER